MCVHFLCGEAEHEHLDCFIWGCHCISLTPFARAEVLITSCTVTARPPRSRGPPPEAQNPAALRPRTICQHTGMKASNLNADMYVPRQKASCCHPCRERWDPHNTTLNEQKLADSKDTLQHSQIPHCFSKQNDAKRHCHPATNIQRHRMLQPRLHSTAISVPSACAAALLRP